MTYFEIATAKYREELQSGLPFSGRVARNGISGGKEEAELATQLRISALGRILMFIIFKMSIYP